MRKTNLFGILLLLFTTHTHAANPPATPSSIYTEDKTSILVTADQPQFTIKLRSNPTTGYSWFLREYSRSFLEPVKHTMEAPADKKLMGAPGYENWTFRVKPTGFTVPQQTIIRLVYARPWSTENQSKLVVFRISTQ